MSCSTQDTIFLRTVLEGIARETIDSKIGGSFYVENSRLYVTILKYNKKTNTIIVGLGSFRGAIESKRPVDLSILDYKELGSLVDYLLSDSY